MFTKDTSRKEKESGSLARFYLGEASFFVGHFARWTSAGLISPNMVSHEKHFIVISRSNHVTIKWAGRAATLPTLKGGRTHGRKRLLTGKMREDHAF